MKKFYLLIVLFYLIVHTSIAQQTDSIGNHNGDEDFLNKRLVEINAELRNSIISLLADSNQIIILKEELKNTNANDIKRQNDLQLSISETEVRFLEEKIELLENVKILKNNIKGFPVIPFADTVYSIYGNLGPFSPKERADATNLKIKKIYDENNYIADSLRIIRAGAFTNVVYKNTIVASVGELDALWNGTKRDQLANEWKTQINQTILNEFEDKSLINIILKTVTVLSTIIFLIIAIYLVNKLFNWIRRKFIENRQNPKIKTIRIRDYELLSELALTSYLSRLIQIVKIIAIFILVYLSLPFILNLFPHTQGYADILLGWILSPIYSIFWALVNYLPNLITVIVIVIVTRYIVKILAHLTNEIKNGKLTIPNFYPDWALPTFNIVRLLLYAFMFIVIFPYLPGSDSPVFKGVSVFLGILISFGSSSAISNAVAGIVITYMRPFKIGDRIRVGEYSGDVIEKSILMTRIRTIKNEEVTIPNSNILSGQTINFSTFANNFGLVLHTSVTIGYDVPWRNMQAALLEAADRTPMVLKDPKPFVLQTSLDDFYVSYQLNIYTREASKQLQITSQMRANILDSCNEAGIEIMSPHYRAERDGNSTTIPQEYLKKADEKK